MSEPTKEYGWVIIDTDEKRSVYHPKRSDDQYWSCDSTWAPVQFAHHNEPFFDDTYRRRIDPGEGCEIVPADGVLQSGDEYTTDGGQSWSVFGDGAFGLIPAYFFTVQASRRRKTVQPSQSQWPKPVFGPRPERCLYWSDVCEMWYGRNDGGSGTFSPDGWWLPMPPNPEPEKPEAEKAWDVSEVAWEVGKLHAYKAAFIAGFNAAKKG